ncbi:MAG: YicC/YloC family endoribonuclease [Candidatus Margulisiibacteriota bacterium]
MLKSMTGFGKAGVENKDIKVSAEIKSVNSAKGINTKTYIPKAFFEKEIEVNTLLSEMLQRGSITLSITYLKKESATPAMTINKPLFKKYYQQLAALAKDVGSSSDVFQVALKSPDVMVNDESSEDGSADWQIIRETLIKAINKCDRFRVTEGKSIQQKLLEYLTSIENNLKTVQKLEPKRVKQIKEKLKDGIADIQAKTHEKADQNRFEQELIYYIERLDINEEIQRLGQHLKYFNETMKNNDDAGKKLGFIAQEMGREINTIGSKANDAEIQRNVVVMKEELEKIKEQLLNVL